MSIYMEIIGSIEELIRDGYDPSVIELEAQNIETLRNDSMIVSDGDGLDGLALVNGVDVVESDQNCVVAESGATVTIDRL